MIKFINPQILQNKTLFRLKVLYISDLLTYKISKSFFSLGKWLGLKDHI